MLVSLDFLSFYKSRDGDILLRTTPTILDDRDVVILNTTEEDGSDGREESSEVKQGCDENLEEQENEETGGELGNIEITVDQKSNELIHENMQRAESEVRKDEYKEKDGRLDGATEDQEMEEESPINRIHSEILEMTRKLSLPEKGLLNLIRAAEEAENEAKRQQEAAVTASPSKERLLLHAMAEQVNTDFSLYGAFKGVTSHDSKQLSNPRTSRTTAVSSKTKLQNEGETADAEKESLSTSPRKDKAIALNGEGPVGDTSAVAQEASELPNAAGKEIERITIERDLLGVLNVLYLRTEQFLKLV